MKSILFFIIIGTNQPVDDKGYKVISDTEREYTIFVQDTCRQIGDTIFIVNKTKIK